ncbi:MAG: hypothetical protein K8I02_11270, partial [Candidatus Methylomirabilis sp.]|nr:hypothetical protein [Deltaproteobacteria bacterium]
MRKPAYIALAALVLPFALGADVKCYPIAAPASPWARMADPASIPTFRGDRALRFSSYDRGLLGETVFGPGNKDFNHFLAACGDAYALTLQTTDGVACEPGAEGYLLAKVSGAPGYVSRIWLAKFPEDVYGEPWHAQRLVVYVDDLATAAVDIPVAEIAAGGTPPFVEPFAGKRSGGLVSYAPIPFERELRVYLRGADNPADVVYHHVDVRLTDQPVAAYAPVPA